MLSKQTLDTYLWVHKLIDTTPDEKWNSIADVLDSNINWQVGHLVISIYYHSILVIKGHQEDVLKQLSLQKYLELYTFNSSPKKVVGKISPKELRNHLDIVEKKSIEVLNSLSQKDLTSDLVPGKVEHPVAKTKFEAIDWNIKHTMWHCGQIASLNRIVHKSYGFELKKTE